jgi:hypothetical protein
MGVRSNFKSIFESEAQILKHKTSGFLRFLKLAAGPCFLCECNKYIPGLRLWVLVLLSVELFKLHLMQFEIKAFLFNEFFMGAHFKDLTLVEHNDFICLSDG